MADWQEWAQDSLSTGAVATVATTMAAAACGQIEDGHIIAPINAVSHILWGDEAAAQEEASYQYTLPGLALNAIAVTGWAGVHELLFGKAAAQGRTGEVLLGGAIVSAIAFVTDYRVVPDRLTPGFEKRLSNGSLLGIYGALALALSVGSLMRHRSKSPSRCA